MKVQSVRIIYAISALLFVAGIVLPPQSVVDYFLPLEFGEYRDLLVQGVWAFRLALVLDSLACILLVRMKGVFVPSEGSRRSVFSFSAREIAILMLIMAGSVLIRLPHFSDGFGPDEIFIYQSLMTRDLPGLLARAENHRVLYALAGKLSCGILGPSEIAARIPALLFGILSIPLVYLMGRKLINSTAGYLSAVLLGLSTFHAWYSQDASMYTMVFFFSVISLLVLPEALDVGRLSMWFGWGGATFLALYSQWYVGFSLFVGEGIYVLLLVLSRRCPIVRMQAFAVVSVCVLAALVTVSSISLPRLPEFIMRMSDIEFRGPVMDNIVLFGQWLTHTYSAWPYQVYFWLLCAAGAVLVFVRSPVTLLYLLLPSIVMLMHWVVTPNKVICSRYGILALLPVVVLTAAALVKIGDFFLALVPGRMRWVAVALVVALTIPLICSAGQSFMVYYSKERYPFRVIARSLSKLNTEHQPVYVSAFGCDKFKFYEPVAINIASYDELRRYFTSTGSFWFVYWFPSYHYDMPSDLKKELERRGKLKLKYTGFPVSVTEHDYEMFGWYVEAGARSGRTESSP
jgi:uncharacterized membrane protein